MISKLWFRWGIPLGSATVLAALLDFGVSSCWALHFFGSFIYLHIWEHWEPVDFKASFGLCIIVSKCILTLSLWTFILLGTRGILLVWLPASVLTDFLLIGLGVYNTTHDLVSDEIWFINLGVVVILRFYITIVIIQALRRLLQNAKVEEEALKNGNVTSNNPNELELQEVEGTAKQDTNGGTPTSDAKFDIIVLDPSQNQNESRQEQHVSSNNPCRFLLLQPIGESPYKIWDFYHDTPRLGAAMLVIFELVWNIFALSTHSLTEFLLGGGMFFMIMEEEILMRIWRIIMDLIAVILIFRKRKTLLRFWLIVYFWTLFASLCIFVYVLADWLYPPPIQVMVICAIFIGDNCVRFGIVYFVLRTTVQPPAVTPTSDLSPTGHRPPDRNSQRNKMLYRSHSLRSQTSPRIKRNSLTKSTRKKYGTQRLQRLTNPDFET